MQSYFTNYEIFNIFKSNKRILLFLFEEKIIHIDEYILLKILTYKYIYSFYFEYFYKEIKQCLHNYQSRVQKIISLNIDLNKIPEIIDEKRKIGENDSKICELIRNDSIKEFIIHVNKTNLPLDSQISPSIYETNNLLLREHATLIEYAAFFGSIRIFNYLKSNKVQLTPSLWIYSIHSNNAEMIHLLEINNVKLPKNDNNYIDDEEEEEEEYDGKRYEICLKESIKCHHCDIINYLLNNYCENERFQIIQSIKNYNFLLIKNDDVIDESFFHDLCKYDYYILVANFLDFKDIDINNVNIFIDVFSYSFMQIKFFIAFNI